MSKPNDYDTYIIPPNFIEGGTFFGGLLKLRNTAEALVIVLAIGIPVFSVSTLTLTAKIIILCLTALPLGIIALVGINGESLSSFIFLVLKYLHNRRVITRNEEEQGKRKKRKKRKAKGGDTAPKYINPVAEYLPVEKIENSIIYTRDHRYLKIVEVVPINFLLRSAREQRNIIYSFISFLKISPVKMQIKVIAKRADLNRHREIVQREMAQETDENCRLLQQDYLTLIDRIGAREATSRRFFMVFEYEAWAGRKRDNEEAEAIASLQTAARTAVNYLKQCGNEVLIPENDDEFTVDTLYHCCAATPLHRCRIEFAGSLPSIRRKGWNLRSTPFPVRSFSPLTASTLPTGGISVLTDSTTPICWCPLPAIRRRCRPAGCLSLSTPGMALTWICSSAASRKPAWYSGWDSSFVSIAVRSRTPAIPTRTLMIWTVLSEAATS